MDQHKEQGEDENRTVRSASFDLIDFTDSDDSLDQAGSVSDKSSEENPPPIPPKRKTKHGRPSTVDLQERLKNAGFSFESVSDNGTVTAINESKEGTSDVLSFDASKQKTCNPFEHNNLDILADTSSLSSGSDYLTADESFSNLVPGTPGAMKTSEIPLPRGSQLSSSGQYFTAKEGLSSGIQGSRNTMQHQSFESRFQTAMQQHQFDFLSKNMTEFETSAKPKQPERRSVHFDMGRSASWENLLSPGRNRNSIKSLSVEDLDALVRSDSVSSAAGDNISLENYSESNAKRKSCPPPRPPPPKAFNRISLPVGFKNKTQRELNDQNLKLYFGDGIFDVSEERNEEATAFCRSVAQLRALFKHTDITNPGYISSPKISFSKSTDVRDVQETEWPLTVYLEAQFQPRSLTCNLSCTVNEVIAQVLSIFQGHFSDVDTISDLYAFKVCGQASYLSGSSPLIDYEYVQTCLKLEKTIMFTLITKNKISRELSRTSTDDEEESQGRYFKHFFELPTSTSVSRQGLIILLETYDKEVTKLLTEITSPSSATYVPERLIQCAKAICLSLSHVETAQIREAVRILLSLKPKGPDQKVYSHGRAGIVDYNRLIDPEQFDKGRFHLALEKLNAGVYALVDIYCKAFSTDFMIQNPKFTRKESEQFERIDARTMKEKLSLRVASAHRIQREWKLKFEYFEVECGLFYGGNPLCTPVVTKLSKPCEGFSEHIRWDEVLHLDFMVKDLPRESRLCLALYGLSSVRKSGTDARSRTELGWIGINLYDFHGLLISGGHLFGLIAGIDMNPAATCTTNYIQERDSVILKVDFEVYHSDVIFPELLLPNFSTISVNTTTPDTKFSQALEEILNRRISKDLTDAEKKMLWENRMHCKSIPEALPFVLVSAPDWGPDNVNEIHDLVKSWKPLTPTLSLELLKANFPDNTVRHLAVSWLDSIGDDELCDYLPQLVQGLKFENYHNSALARFLIKHALTNPRIAHYLFWHLKYYTADAQFGQRFQIVLGGLLSICGACMRDQLSRQDQMVQLLGEMTKRVKETKDTYRRIVLTEETEAVSTELADCIRLPIDPALKVSVIIPDECSYFSSFTVPLSLAFQNADPRGQLVNVMFKVGDDLRKDLVTLQLFRIMNRLWLQEGINLKMITYECMPTAPLTGMIELVPNAATLRKIHVEHGLTGSFKDETIALWLQKYNQSEDDYKKVVDKFTASCAGCCVSTFVLGIGDRHNDNIMVTKSGHLFHIDFSKFMGNVQKFGTIKRDRVPFVLTPDMAYVINQGEIMSSNFQHFVELCCEAYNIIRHNASLILNLLGLMVSSGIPYLSNEEDLEYVRHALQLQLSDAEATVFFTRLLESSLSSKATQLNFFIHNVAHFKSTSPNASGTTLMFSFSTKVYSKESDGEILSARVVDFQKRYLPEKHYIFVINVLRQNSKGAKFVFRKYEEFQELHGKLCHVFRNTPLPQLPSRIIVGRSQIREVAVRRRQELDDYVIALTKLESVSDSEILYTFFHSYVRDEQDTAKFSDILYMLEEGGPQSRVGGEIKLSYQYREFDQTLHVLIMHVRNLIPPKVQGYAEPYVKSYLLPDPTKATKQKTRIIRRSLNPTYNETLKYKMPYEDLQRHTLQVTVWDHDGLKENEYLGGVNIYLSTVDLTREKTQWYKLKDLGLA